MNTNQFSIFLTSGTENGMSIIDAYLRKITKIFDELSEKEYSTDVDQFHLTMRVDGENYDFGDSEGCNSLRFFKKKRLIANSISFGSSVYIDEKTLSAFLKKNLILAFEQMITRIKKDKLNVNGELLLEDFSKYLEEW